LQDSQYLFLFFNTVRNIIFFNLVFFEQHFILARPILISRKYSAASKFFNTGYLINTCEFFPTAKDLT